MRRPDFGSLNPVRKLNYVGNPILINNGSQGNHDLKTQKSDSFDASAEYYFHNGFVALTGFYRTIQDRVVSSQSQQVIDGETRSEEHTSELQSRMHKATDVFRLKKKTNE